MSTDLRSHKQLIREYYDEFRKVYFPFENIHSLEENLKFFIKKFLSADFPNTEEFYQHFFSSMQVYKDHESSITLIDLVEEVIQIEPFHSKVMCSLDYSVTFKSDAQSPTTKELFPKFFFHKGSSVVTREVTTFEIVEEKIIAIEIVSNNIAEKIMRTQEWASLYVKDGVNVHEYINQLKKFGLTR